MCGSRMANPFMRPCSWPPILPAASGAAAASGPENGGSKSPRPDPPNPSLPPHSPSPKNNNPCSPAGDFLTCIAGGRMPPPFTDEEYRRIMMLTFLGEWMLNAIRKDPDPAYEDAASKVYSLARGT